MQARIVGEVLSSVEAVEAWRIPSPRRASIGACKQATRRASLDGSRYSWEVTRLNCSPQFNPNVDHRCPFLPDSSRSPGAPNSAPLLSPGFSMAVTTRFGCYQEELKGEDGLRCERVEIGGDNLVFALLVDGHGGHQAASIVIGDLLPCMAGYLNDDPSAESLRHAASMAFQELHDQVRDPSNQTTAARPVPS